MFPFGRFFGLSLPPVCSASSLNKPGPLSSSALRRPIETRLRRLRFADRAASASFFCVSLRLSSPSACCRISTSLRRRPCPTVAAYCLQAASSHSASSSSGGISMYAPSAARKLSVNRAQHAWTSLLLEDLAGAFGSSHMLPHGLLKSLGEIEEKTRRLHGPAGRWSDCTPACAGTVGHLGVEIDRTGLMHAPKRKRPHPTLMQ